MNKDKFKGLLISDFNADILAGYMNNDGSPPAIIARTAPFGQVIGTLLDKNMECWKDDHDFAVIFTQPESVIPSFRKILDYERLPIDKIMDEVDQYSDALLGIGLRAKVVFHPTWVFPTYHRGYGMIDMKSDAGIENILMHMNLRLSKNLTGASNIFVLNAGKWIETAGKNAFDTKLWYMAKIPFSNTVFKEAMKDIKAALMGVSGNARKIIILDLDDTLWGGIAGDLGWENIKLGGHDHIGEAYLDFQKGLKALSNRGIILGIVSKNEESVALEAINKHPEMILRMKDFAGWKINWEDKARNIIDLLADLKLGLQSAIFIDDNPAERARVKETLPEVMVPDWPEDKMLYKRALLSLDCFDAPVISGEDAERTKMYLTERDRQALKNKVGSLSEWLRASEIKVTVETLKRSNSQRATQLLNKTNQMNLATRRMTESELMDWAGQAKRKLWTFRVSDKFGDSGLTGLISLEQDQRRGTIVDFVLSCRVIGRKVEETMLYVLINYARSAGLDEIRARYLPTAKNKPCLDFLKRSRLVHNASDDTFSWNARNTYEVPEFIQIEGELT